MPEKNFDEWNILKQNLETAARNKLIREGDVWFCSIGKNVGHEQNGKHLLFERPVLIVRKFTADYFWGVPLSSSVRGGSYSMSFEFQGATRCALLFHMRSYDCKRLQRYTGKISREMLVKMRVALIGLLVKQKDPVAGVFEVERSALEQQASGACSHACELQKVAQI